MARIPFIAVLIALFGVGMAGLLMLNTTLQNQAFEGRALTRQANELIYSQAELEGAISRRASPRNWLGGPRRWACARTRSRLSWSCRRAR